MAAETHTTLTPDTPVRYLKGVGPKTAERFEKLGIVTLADLLCHYPRRYLDFSKPYTIATAPPDTECVVKAEVFAKPGGRVLPGGRRMERITAGDDVSSLEITWFNNPYAAQKLELGREYYFQGIVTGGMLRRQMVNPQVRTDAQVESIPFEAVYPPDGGAFQRGHCQMRPPAPPPRGAPARPSPAGNAAKVPPALQGGGRPGHPLPRQRGRGLCGPAAAHLRRAVDFAAWHWPDEEPGCRPHRCPHAKDEPGTVLGLAAILPHWCPAPGRGGNFNRHGGRDFHEPPAAGRRGQR